MSAAAPAEAKPDIAWKPHPGSQPLFLSCPHFECLIEGTRGPGKSTALLMSFAQFVRQGYGEDWRGVLFRRTYKQLDDIVAKSRIFHRIFPDARFNKADYVWQWETGEELLFRYMDSEKDYWNYHGHEYPWIGWDELTNWPTLACYHLMKSCSRSKRQGMPRLYRATCNPYGVGHNAVKAYFVDPQPRSGVPFDPPSTPLPEGVEIPEAEDLKAVRITGYYWENTTLMEADPQYPAKIAAAAPNPEAAKAWLKADWDIVAGGVIDDVWRRALHVLEPFAIPPGWRINRSFDWGETKPFSVGWWAESDGSPVELADGTVRVFPKGTIFRIAEWYGSNGQPNEGCRMLAVEIADGILERERSVPWGSRVKGGQADPAIFTTINGACIADDLEKRGVRMEPADNNRAKGLQEIRKRLKAGWTLLEGKPMEDPGLFVFANCRNSIRTVPTLPRDEKKPDDADTNAEDHCYDEWRYRCLAQRRGLTTKLIGV